MEKSQNIIQHARRKGKRQSQIPRAISQMQSDIQPSMMQSSPLSNLQQNQQSNKQSSAQQATQSGVQKHPQSVRQLQASNIDQQQGVLPTQQQQHLGGTQEQQQRHQSAGAQFGAISQMQSDIQPSMMQSSPLSNLQQNQRSNKQSSAQQATQSGVQQHPQSVRQLQASNIDQQQGLLPTQQQQHLGGTQEQQQRHQSAGAQFGAISQMQSDIQPSMMQSSPLSNLQQNQQSNKQSNKQSSAQQATQSGVQQHPQSVRQLQASNIDQQQGVLPTQQQQHLGGTQEQQQRHQSAGAQFGAISQMQSDMQPSMMQSSQLSNLQQNQQSNKQSSAQQTTQSGVQHHPQSVRQLQASNIDQQQGVLPTQQQQHLGGTQEQQQRHQSAGAQSGAKSQMQSDIQPSMMQSSPLSNLQQNQQSNKQSSAKQTTQSGVQQHPQSVRQLQASNIDQQQGVLPTQQQQHLGGTQEQQQRHQSAGAQSDSAPIIRGKLCLTSPDENVKFELEENLATILRDYQVDGVKWLFGLHVRGVGGILGDEMGLGKTKQVCAFLKGLFNTSSIKRVMIVSPSPLLKNWTTELASMQLEIKYGISVNTYPGQAKATKAIVEGSQILLVSNYRLNGDELYTGLFNRLKWDHVILDEGHLLKNPRGVRSQNVQKIRAKSGAFIILTGTAIQNNLKELWALMNICNKKLLSTEGRFHSDYGVTIMLGNHRDIDQITDVCAREAAKKLQKLVEPCYLRREKNVVLKNQIADKDELVIWLKPTPLQQKMYMKFLDFFAKNGHRGGIHKDPLPSLRILEDLCLHPTILKKQARDNKTGSARNLLRGFMNLMPVEAESQRTTDCSVKINFLREILTKIIEDGESVLIFSGSCKMLDLVQEEVIEGVYKYVRMDGSTSRSMRDKAVKEFQKGKVNIFLLSIRVGALGLNLIKATKVVLLEPNWNPSYDNQAVDRAHRFGQTKDVVVYRLICSGTIEERTYRTQIFKNTLARSLHCKNEAPLKLFNPKDVIKAFSASERGFNRSETKGEIDKLFQLHNSDLPAMKTSIRDHIRSLESKDCVAGVTYHTEVISRVTKSRNSSSTGPRLSRVTTSPNSSSYSTGKPRRKLEMDQEDPACKKVP